MMSAFTGLAARAVPAGTASSGAGTTGMAGAAAAVGRTIPAPLLGHNSGRPAAGPTCQGKQITCQATSAAQGALTPPRSIWAVGKNYLEHIKELKTVLDIDQDIPQEPIIFLKAGACLLEGTADQPTPLPLPAWSDNVHHEVELAIQLGTDLQPVRAAVAIDMTARDVQASLKSKGYPWTLGKSFRAACPIGPFFYVSGVDLHALTLGLQVNDGIRQQASTEGMIFKVPSLLHYLSSRYPLSRGDLILTGTPEGVGRLVAGDRVDIWVKDKGGRVLSEAAWNCVAEAEEGSSSKL